MPLVIFSKEIMFDQKLKTTEDMFTNFSSSINNHQTVYKERKPHLHQHFSWNYAPFVILSWHWYSLLYGNLVPSIT